MAEQEDKSKEQGGLAIADLAATETEAKSSDGLGDDLADVMGLFTEEDSIDENLTMLTSSLDEVEIHDLLEQVREIQDIMNALRSQP